MVCVFGSPSLASQGITNARSTIILDRMHEEKLLNNEAHGIHSALSSKHNDTGGHVAHKKNYHTGHGLASVIGKHHGASVSDGGEGRQGTEGIHVRTSSNLSKAAQEQEQAGQGQGQGQHGGGKGGGHRDGSATHHRGGSSHSEPSSVSKGGGGGHGGHDDQLIKQRLRR